MDKNIYLQGYRDTLSKDLSQITIKNYISDINHFIDWGERELGTSFSEDLFEKSVVDTYYSTFIQKTESGESAYAYKSLKRHLSSLRSFTSYLEKSGFLKQNPFISVSKEEIPNPWKIDAFKTFLHKKGSSKLTIKYYINDVQSLSRWCKEVSGNTQENAQHPEVSNELINEYIQRLKGNLELAPTSINRKLSSIRNYLEFLKQESLQNQDVSFENLSSTQDASIAINELIIPEIKEVSYSKIPPVRLGQKILKPYLAFEENAARVISSELVRLHLGKIVKSTKNLKSQKLDDMIKGLRGKGVPKEFYAPYQISISSYPIHKKLIFHARHTRPKWYKTYHKYPFVHYLHFSVLVIFAVSASIFFYDNTLGKARAQEGMAANPTLSRTFVFKGRLLDRNNNPITEASPVRLAIYDTPTSSGSALLWQEVQTVKPSDNGNVSIIIGSNSQIPDAYMNGNIPLFLGVTIGNGPELSPRKQLGVPFADNAGAIQGYIPNTVSDRQSNVLLALDSTGNLSIGGQANPTFQATGGDFTLSGQTLILQTNASSDGNVVINPSGNGKIDLQKPLINSAGESQSVEILGGLAISATNSASPAILINQESGAPLIVANTIGSTRFSVDSQGVITKGIWAGLPIGTEFGGFGANISATGPGELLFSTSSTSYGHLTPGVAGQCLTSNGRAAPMWSTCGFLTQLNGVTTLTNNTVDVLLGDSSTSSAKFAFVNMNTGTPIFKIGNNLNFDSNGNVYTNNTNLSIGGNSTKNVVLLTSNGNIGAQQQNPTRSFDVFGNWGGNVDFYSDGSNTQTITRNAKALVYDLEKSTGSSNTSTTTTYNIVGLPDVDGTFAYVYTKVSKDTTAASQSQTIRVDINGNQISTLSSVPGILPSTVIKHFTAVRSNNTWHLLGDSGNSDTADLAEWISSTNPLPEPGSIVSFNDSGNVAKSETSHDPKLAGIISTNPNIVIGPQTASSVRLALSGRIPVMVTGIRGPILVGDPITSSVIPGFGMKPARNSAVVGKAIQGFNPTTASCKEAPSMTSLPWPTDNGTNADKPCFKIKASSLSQNLQNELSQKYGITTTDHIYVGKIMAIANLSWSDASDLLTSVQGVEIHDDSASNSIDGDLAAQMDSINNVDPTVTVGKEAVQNVGVFSQAVSGKIKTGVLSANTILAKNIAADSASIASLSAKSIEVAQNLTIQGKPLSEFISESVQKAISPLVATNNVATNIISPLASGTIAIELPDASSSALLVRNKNTQENVFKVDARGNVTAQGSITTNTASVSGQLAAGSISSQNLTNSGDATISGTLRANSIIASDINGLDEKVATVAASLIANLRPVQNAPSSVLGDTLAATNINAQFGTFSQGLLSLGASTFGNLSVTDMLSIGTTLNFSQNAVNTLGSDLEIQPLRQAGVSFLAGSIKIQADGQLIANENAIFNKDIAVKGKIYTNLISPLPDGDVSVQLPNGSTRSAQFSVKNASSSAVLSINKEGDVVASGSGTFSKINISVVGQALASNENEAIATGSAGTAILKANKTELTILNPQVSDHSLIYVTPAQNTYNQVLFLMRQTPKTSFTVGVSQPISKDIIFNWIIVN